MASQVRRVAVRTMVHPRTRRAPRWEDPSTKEAVIALLAKKIPKRYTTSTHGAVRTSEEAAEVRGATLASGAKAMLLSVRGARDANEFVLVVISAAAKMDSKAAQEG